MYVLYAVVAAQTVHLAGIKCSVDSSKLGWHVQICAAKSGIPSGLVFGYSASQLQPCIWCGAS